MIPVQPGLFCSGLSDFLYIIRPRPVWSDLVVLFCPLVLLDDFFHHLSMKNFIFFKKIILVRSAAVGFARQILYNNRAFQGYYIIYILFTSFNIFLLLLFFSLLLSFLFSFSFVLLVICLHFCSLNCILYLFGNFEKSVLWWCFSVCNSVCEMIVILFVKLLN